MARYPAKREDVEEWILLIGCVIPLAMPIIAAAVGAAAAGVGAVVGGIAGSELGAVLRAVCLLLIEKGGRMLGEVIGFLCRFVKGDIFKILTEIKFAKYGDAIAKTVDKFLVKLIEIVKGVETKLRSLP